MSPANQRIRNTPTPMFHAFRRMLLTCIWFQSSFVQQAPVISVLEPDRRSMTTTMSCNVTYTSLLMVRYFLFHSHVLEFGCCAALPKPDPSGRRCNGNV